MNIKNVPFQRLGNKTNDIKYFKNLIPLDDDTIKTVIEPFAGSFAVSGILFDPTKYKIILIDNDKQLIDIIKNINTFHFELEKFRNIIIDDKPTNKELLQLIKDSKYENALQSKFIVRGMIKATKNKIDCTKLNIFLDNVHEIKHEDFKIKMNEYINDESAFIFCDPPYFDSDNSDYNDYSKKTDDDKIIKDNTGIYSYLAEYIKNCKCKIMIVVNDNELMTYIFKNYIKST
jgi:site-specific DNA-adenine methylase